MNFDMLKYRYPSRRSVICGRRGMVCTSQPLAAQAGLDILKKGGNAVDAAIATAVCMTVLEPTGNGLGSDAFDLLWFNGKLYGLNGSGGAPKLQTLEKMQDRGYKDMPYRGWDSVTVPGAVSAWSTLHRRFGRLPFKELFAAAVDYAENGFPVHPVTSRLWNDAVKTFAPFQDRPEFRPFFETFLKEGAPAAGRTVKLPDHGRTLRELAETEGESFYRGALARAVDAFSRETGGLIRADDLEDYHAQWVEPIMARYKGFDVCEIPPNGHGIVALMALNILQKLDTSMGRDAESTVHRQLEAMKLAFTDGLTYIADPRFMKMKTEYLLSDAYAAVRSGEIGEDALMPRPIDPQCGGTVYMCTADAEGNMVSHIQSNFRGFGSGIVIPGTGIALNDRGCGFKLDPRADGCIAPGKKPYHTIIPGFLMKDGQPLGPFGVMGGYMQPQGHVQVVMNLVDYALNPQEALDAPRWQWLGGKKIEIESAFAPEVAEGLRRRGHDVTVADDFITFGRGQMILRGEDGVLIGATESRADGCVAAW